MIIIFVSNTVSGFTGDPGFLAHKKISKLKYDASTKQKDDDSDEIKQFAKIAAMQSLNESFQSIGESPIKKKRLGEGKYPTRQMKATEKVAKTRKCQFKCSFLHRLMLRF
jgi:hypothetical protein